MRALVTGCAGFIGSHLTESLLGDGHEVLGVDCFNDNYERSQKLANLRTALDFDSFRFARSDLADADASRLIDGRDTVFHLAAEPGVRSSWGARFDAYLRNNVAATQRLLEAALPRSDLRFVYASSSSVYGDGRQTRDFTYVADVVAATRAAAVTDAAPGRVYNVGGGSRVSIRRALEVLAAVAGGRLDVRFEPREHGDAANTGAEITCARRDLGFAPSTSLEAALLARGRGVAARGG